jgi:transglutaminase-like putative cysteine protease
VLKKLTSIVLFLFLVNLFPGTATAGVPDWLRSLAQQPAKKYADDVNAVILFRDQATTVKENGEIVRHERIAVRVLRPEGRDWATFPVFYDSDSKVEFLRGWSITSKGQEYESKDLIERSVSSFEVYSDTKAKIVHVPGADVGTVVGFEYERKGRPYIFQDFWGFQTEDPVEQSRYELHLSAGWRFRADWINYPQQKPTEENGTVSWQLDSVPRIEREPRRPSEDALAGRMVVTFLSDKVPGKSYRDWSEFGSWYTQLSDGVRNSSPALQQKVLELAPANLPILERIKALARFAQSDVRYVEISIGVGGWRPHSADDIFAHRYGDCKDKATVLSSMLSQIGVKSYYLLVETQRGIFTEKSPPQARFNHMILAIALPEASYPNAMPAMYQHPKLGRLLIFDPTNDLVPFGQIPPYEQDNYGLLVGEQGGDLIHLPLSNPEANKISRNAKLTLMPDGTLQGEIEEVRSGYMAMLERGRLQHQTDKDRKKMLELMGANIGSFQIDSFDLRNENEIDKDLVLHYKFTATHYAKTAGSLLLVRPRVIGEMAGVFDVTKPRHYAYEFEGPFLRSDSVEITLPDGYSIDELPEPTKAVFPFAEYTSKSEKAGNVLKYTREYKMQTTQVPLDGMEQLRKLFAQIGADEKNMAVLKKSN